MADLAQRTGIKGKHFTTAGESLNDPRRSVLRRIAYVLIKKAQYLFYYTEGKQHVALTTIFPLYSHALEWSFRI